jgi:hypothetical protein
VQIKDKEEEKTMRRGCRQAGKRRVQIKDKEEEKAMRRGCRQAGKRRVQITQGGREGNEEGVQASRKEKSAD